MAPAAAPSSAASGSSAQTTRGPGRLGEEAHERGLQRLEPAVELEVVGLDVGDDGGVAGQLEEGAVALVGLDHEQVALVPDRAGADLVDVAADDERRAQPGLDQHEGQHRRGRRLAVGAGHRDAAAGGGDGGQGLGPAQHRDAALVGGHDLGVAGRDGGRDGDRVERRPAGWRRRGRRSPPTPRARSRSSPADSLRSLPDTWWPMAASTVAMALMPAPPMPTTWTRGGSVRSSTGEVAG